MLWCFGRKKFCVVKISFSFWLYESLIKGRKDNTSVHFSKFHIELVNALASFTLLLLYCTGYSASQFHCTNIVLVIHQASFTVLLFYWLFTWIVSPYYYFTGYSAGQFHFKMSVVSVSFIIP